MLDTVGGRAPGKMVNVNTHEQRTYVIGLPSHHVVISSHWMHHQPRDIDRNTGYQRLRESSWQYYPLHAVSAPVDRYSDRCL
jgi:hypothetical protein